MDFYAAGADAADAGHDDCVMTIVNATTVFNRNDFIEMVDEWMNKSVDKDFLTYINDILKNISQKNQKELFSIIGKKFYT